MVGERCAGLRKDILKHPSHREYGRTGIDLALPPTSVMRILPPGLAGTLDDGDGQSARSQEEGGHEAADPGSDHDHAGGAHAYTASLTKRR